MIANYILLSGAGNFADAPCLSYITNPAHFSAVCLWQIACFCARNWFDLGPQEYWDLYSTVLRGNASVHYYIILASADMHAGDIVLWGAFHKRNSIPHMKLMLWQNAMFEHYIVYISLCFAYLCWGSELIFIAHGGLCAHCILYIAVVSSLRVYAINGRSSRLPLLVFLVSLAPIATSIVSPYSIMNNGSRDTETLTRSLLLRVYSTARRILRLHHESRICAYTLFALIWELNLTSTAVSRPMTLCNFDLFSWRTTPKSR